MKKILKSMPTTSFHGSTITATLDDLIKILGEPSSICLNQDEKVQYEWLLETKNGTPFTVYDWKEYREILPDSEIDWYIGTEYSFQSNTVRSEILSSLSDRYTEDAELDEVVDDFEENFEEYGEEWDPSWEDDVEYEDHPCDHCANPDWMCENCLDRG